MADEVYPIRFQYIDQNTIDQANNSVQNAAPPVERIVPVPYVPAGFARQMDKARSQSFITGIMAAVSVVSTLGRGTIKTPKVKTRSINANKLVSRIPAAAMPIRAQIKPRQGVFNPRPRQVNLRSKPIDPKSLEIVNKVPVDAKLRTDTKDLSTRYQKQMFQEKTRSLFSEKPVNSQAQKVASNVPPDAPLARVAPPDRPMMPGSAKAVPRDPNLVELSAEGNQSQYIKELEDVLKVASDASKNTGEAAKDLSSTLNSASDLSNAGGPGF